MACRSPKAPNFQIDRVSLRGTNDRLLTRRSTWAPTNPMIRSANSTRFTPNEVHELRQVGLDLADARCQNDIDAEMTRWAHTLAVERFELLKQIAAEMAKAKGVKLPPKLSVAK